MPHPAADGVRRTTAAEDGSVELVLEESASPISWERSNRKDIPAAADQPGDVSSIVAGEIRIGPLDSQLGDCRIGQGKRSIPDILQAARARGVADVRRECFRLIDILDIQVAGVW